jgi:predicted ferric reductase
MTAGTAWQAYRPQPSWPHAPGARWSAPAWRRPSAARPTPSWWRDAVGAFTWATVLVTVALWVGHRGLQDLVGVSSGLTSLGRLTGLLSADLLLVQVLLMARIPVLERSYGQDRLAHWHRLVGFTSFNLLLAHLALTTLGYAGSAHTNPVKEFVDVVVDYPGMLMALAGTLALVAVTVSSVKRARAKVRYESWHLIHLYGYLGVGLAIPHEVWTGTEFTSSTIATAYWWSLYAAAASSVLIWRVGVPLWRSRRHHLVVEGVVREAPGVVSVYLRGRDLDLLHTGAGQFFTWRFRSGPGWTRGHPYSLSAAPRPDRLRITVKDLGDGSRALATLRPGTKVLFEGPYGRMHPGVRTRRKVTLMASGIGISPMRALLEELDHAPGELTLIYRAHHSGDLPLRNEIDAIAAQTGARVFYVLGRRVPGRNTWLPESAAHLTDAAALRQLVPDIAEHDVYLCGAAGWMDAAHAAALAAGVPAGNVHVERFSW